MNSVDIVDVIYNFHILCCCKAGIITIIPQFVIKCIAYTNGGALDQIVLNIGIKTLFYTSWGYEIKKNLDGVN